MNVFVTFNRTPPEAFRRVQRGVVLNMNRCPRPIVNIPLCRGFLSDRLRAGLTCRGLPHGATPGAPSRFATSLLNLRR